MPLPKFLYKLFGGNLEQQGSSDYVTLAEAHAPGFPSWMIFHDKPVDEIDIATKGTTDSFAHFAKVSASPAIPSSAPNPALSLYSRMVAAVEAEKGKDLCGLNAAQRSARTAAGNRTRREKRIALQREVTARLREGV